MVAILVTPPGQVLPSYVSTMSFYFSEKSLKLLAKFTVQQLVKSAINQRKQKQ